MQNQFKGLIVMALLLTTTELLAQESTNSKREDEYQVNTLFKGHAKASGGYGAITNKFTTINGEFANLAGVYGGWFVNHNFMIGLGAAALTNTIQIPAQYRIDPLKDSYMYTQFGMVTEYVIASSQAVHVAVSLFSGAGYTAQYQRQDWDHGDHHEHDWNGTEDDNFFFVAEPGVMVEVNLTKWMRFSPGISYRAAFGSDARGLTDNSLSDLSYNATFKFGKF